MTEAKDVPETASTAIPEADSESLARLAEELAAADEAELRERRDRALFYNVTVVDDNDIKRLVALTINQTKGMWIYRVFIMIFGLFFVLYGLVTLIELLSIGSGIESGLSLVMLILGAVLIWYGWKGILVMTQRRLAKQAEGFKGTREYAFYDRGFDYIEGGSVSPVAWSEISKTVEDERSFYLRCQRAWLIVHQDTFTRGSVSDFREFLAKAVKPQKQSFW